MYLFFKNLLLLCSLAPLWAASRTPNVFQPQTQKIGTERVALESRQHIWIIYKILQRFEKEDALTRAMMLYWADDSLNAYWTAQLLGLIERRGDRRSIDTDMLQRCIDSGPHMADIVRSLMQSHGSITQWHLDKTFQLYTQA